MAEILVYIDTGQRKRQALIPFLTRDPYQSGVAVIGWLLAVNINERGEKMEKKYTMSVDTARKLIDFKMWGHWSEEEGDVFMKEYRSNVDQLSAMGGGFYTLADFTEYAAQKQEIQEKHVANMGYAVQKGLLKSAHIVSKAVTGMQMGRLAKEVDSDRIGQFNTRKEALAWLFGSSGD